MGDNVNKSPGVAFVGASLVGGALLAVAALTICTTSDRKRRQRLNDENRDNIPHTMERSRDNAEEFNTEIENVYSYVGNGPDVLPQQPVAPPVLSEFDYAIDKSLGMNLDKPSGHREDDLILQENRYENSFAVHQDGFPPDKEYYQNLRSIANAADKPSKENEYDANSNRCSSNGPINKDNEKDIYNQLNHGNQQAVVMKTRDPSYSHLQPLGTYQSTVPRPLSVPQAEYIYQNQSELYEDRIKMHPDPPIQPGSCTFEFRFICLSEVKTAWTEIFGPK
uniref:Uncharacterized protein n=1 Tax=Magallana gigas TaxID=29159 RepID=K1PGG1_MAGGI